MLTLICHGRLASMASKSAGSSSGVACGDMLRTNSRAAVSAWARTGGACMRHAYIGKLTVWRLHARRARWTDIA